MPSTINITLPDSLSKYVEAQVESGDFGTPGQYIRDLIEEDRTRRLQKLEAHLLAALDEEPIEVPDDVWESGDIVAFLETAVSAHR